MSFPPPHNIAWYRAGIGMFSDAGITPAVAGDGVYQWNDQSGNGNNLLQTTAANRPIYNTYTAAVSAAGPADIAPFGTVAMKYQPSLSESVLFDGSMTSMDLPTGVALTNAGCTVIMCTRGSQQSLLTLGGTPSLRYGTAAGSPCKMQLFDGAAYPFPMTTYLPVLTPIVHGFVCEPGHTRMYIGARQTSDLAFNCLSFYTSGGTLGTTFNGEIYELMIFDTPLSDADIQTYLANMQASNGIGADANRNQVIFIGDSLTTGGPGVLPMSSGYPWPLCQLYADNIKPMVLAVPGHTIAQQQTIVSAQLPSLDLSSFDSSVSIVCAGSIDAANGRSIGDICTDLANLCNGIRSLDIKVIVTTMQSQLTALNTAVRSGFSTYADRLADWAADPRLMDPTNTVYFQADSIHTTAAGDAIKAAIVKSSLDDLFNETTPGINPVMNYASFYAAGRSYAASFGRFVRS